MIKHQIINIIKLAMRPLGFGEFSINKKNRKKFKKVDGVDIINLPNDKK